MADETSDTPFDGPIQGLDDLDLDPSAGTGPDTDSNSGSAARGGDDDLGADDDLGQPLTAEAAARQLAEARSRLAAVPAEVVVTNHAMGLYELAAIHLSADPPDGRQAALAIDAFACLVEGLDDRLGTEAPTMRDALANIRMAFVQITNSGSSSG